MRVTMWGLVSIVVVLTAAGCGGGGGGVASGISAGAPATLSAPLPSEMTGTWTVQNLGLPNDQMVVQTDGQVVIDTAGSRSVSSTTRSASYTRIGTAKTDGSLDLNGRWTSSGTEYSITGSGNIDTSTRSVAVQATVQRGSAVLHQETVVHGIKGTTPEGLDYPPPPPVMTSDAQQELDYPPPPPTFD
ncbi:MAG: hypothetical protein M1133_04710 [Armatimonadetes bacterium]|nr:hypothetical protein [Armatimonadota bacterium]